MKIPTTKLIFLGTGTSQGVPVIGSTHPVCKSTCSKDKRLRASVYLKINEKEFIIDCGPDFRQQMLRNNIDNLHAILFTHEHNDHMIGLDDVRPIFFKNQKNLDLYGQKRVLGEVKKRFPYSFQEKTHPSIARFNLHNINEDSPFLVEGIQITPIPVMHGKLPILGYRFTNLAYLTDASNIADSSLQKLQNLEVLIINALRKSPAHSSHFTLKEALNIVEILKPKQAYITHISHLMGFHEEVESELPSNVHLAYDGLEICC